MHFVFRRQPDIAAKKTRVKGRDISSAPDVICYGIEGNISCIVKVLHVCLAATVKIYVTNNVHHVIISVCFKRKSSFNTACMYAIFSKLKELNPSLKFMFQVDKSRKCSDLDGIPDSKKSRQDESPGRDKCISDCFAQHTGDLLAFSEHSISHMDICGRAGRDILGFIVENTHVSDLSNLSGFVMVYDFYPINCVVN